MIKYVEYIGTLITIHYTVCCLVLIYLLHRRHSIYYFKYFSGLFLLIYGLGINGLFKLSMDTLYFSSSTIIDEGSFIITWRFVTRFIDATAISLFLFSFFKK